MGVTTRKNLDNLKEIVKKETNDNINIISNEYKNQYTPLKFIEKDTGHVYTTTWKMFKKGHRCPICNKERIKTFNTYRDINWLREEFNKIADSLDYEIMSEEYHTNKDKLKFLCKKCNTTFNMTWGDFRNGHRCSNCKRKKLKEIKKLNFNEVKNRIEKNGLYTLLSEEKDYKDKTSYLKVRHEKCKKIFDITLNQFDGGRRCDCLKVGQGSRGENLIEEFFCKYKVDYQKQYKVKINKKNYYFDFMVTDKNKNNIFIEFDGIQHFREVKAFGGKSALEKTKLNDSIKNNYCKENNIPLIRISYLQINRINNILRFNTYIAPLLCE